MKKGEFVMKRHHVLTGILIVLSMLVGCVPGGTEGPLTGEPQLSYEVSECNQDIGVDQLADWAKVDIAVQGDAVEIDQNLAYVCCAEVEIDVEQEEDIVKVIEKNTGDMCRCMCGYEVTARISDLPSGRYTIQVWGVAYRDLESPELLGEEEVEL
jgi:hypothetical protein